MEVNDHDEHNLAEPLIGNNDVETATSALDDSIGEIIVDPQAGQTPRGESQMPEYKDAPFALVFVVQLIGILFFATFWGLGSLKQDDTMHDKEEPYTTTTSLWGFCFLLFFISSCSIGIASACLDFMTNHVEKLMQASLMICCVALSTIVVLLFANDTPGFGFCGIFVLICTGMYAYSVQNRIPFASANLKTALSAIKMNYGVCMLSYGIAFVANLWLVVWLLAFLGVSFRSSNCEDGLCQLHPSPGAIFILIASYFWTAQVLQNVIHVTVAGVVGTWWFAPQEAGSAFSSAVFDSFTRATTYSFGSICFGSLLVAIVQALERMVRSARQHRNSMLLCLVECLLEFLQRMGRYFNKFGFVYVGLYGYDYMSAGRKALELFRSRGWSAIINDDLAHRLLMLVCVVVGALAGVVGLLVNELFGWADSILGENAHASMFAIGFSIGYSLANILMGVVLSAVDSVIVCFAEAPGEFQSNHPALSEDMIAAWRKVYPQECGV